MENTCLQRELKNGYHNKLKGRIYGLLCTREENGEWEKALDNIIIQLLDFDEQEKSINYYELLTKLQSLRYLRYYYFRKTIFDCLDLFDSVG